MERQVAQMVRLIDDLLDLSRVSRGRIELKKERADVASLVHGALELCGTAIAAGGHRLTLDLPTSRCHSRAIRRACAGVCNLISNAAKYTPPAAHHRRRTPRRGRRRHGRDLGARHRHRHPARHAGQGVRHVHAGRALAGARAQGASASA
jgi:signal transduction histidine kinase